MVEISIKGKLRFVPSIVIGGRTFVARGSWIKRAVVHDELYVPNGIVTESEEAIARLRSWVVKPDIFEFSQGMNETEVLNHPFEWDNLAVLRITDYQTWLTTSAKKDVKENLRRAAREGVVVQACPFDDSLVAGIKNLYDQTPLRQGRPFWHHGKTEKAIRKEAGHYLDRSEFIGAFHQNILIGFIKMVYVGNIAKTMYVISSERHFRMRPANAMLAKAVEICAEKGVEFLNYGVYEYPGKKENSLTDFKSRHGFARYDYRRYYVPLTIKGRIFLALRLHRGIKRLIPMKVLAVLLTMRSALHHWVLPASKQAPANSRD